MTVTMGQEIFFLQVKCGEYDFKNGTRDIFLQMKCDMTVRMGQERDPEYHLYGDNKEQQDTGCYLKKNDYIIQWR